MLQTLWGYCLLVGCALLPAEYARRLAVVVAPHHGFMAVKGVLESDRAWATGNPWWDVGIHLAFVAATALSVRRPNEDFAPRQARTVGVTTARDLRSGGPTCD